MKMSLKARNLILAILQLTFLGLFISINRINFRTLVIFVIYIFVVSICWFCILKYEDKIIYRDSLSLLYSREKFSEDAKYKLNKFNKFALVYLDFKKFKSINDTFGHEVGNHVIKQFGLEMLKLPQNYYTYRYGGDEFVVIINNYGDLKESINKILNVNVNYGNEAEQRKLEFNIGVAVYPQDSLNIRTLLEKADNYLYMAKKSDVSCIYN